LELLEIDYALLKSTPKAVLNESPQKKVRKQTGWVRLGLAVSYSHFIFLANIVLGSKTINPLRTKKLG